MLGMGFSSRLVIDRPISAPESNAFFLYFPDADNCLGILAIPGTGTPECITSCIEYITLINDKGICF